MSGTISILIADDHPTLQSGLAGVLRNQDDMEVVGECSDGAAAVSMYRALRPAVVVMDLKMPGLTGEDAIRQIIDLDPDARIIALTTFGGLDSIRETVAAGAVGYILKNSLRRDIVRAIRTVAAGGRFLEGEVAETLATAYDKPSLTPRELDVLRTLALGHSNKNIAYALGISEATVKVHLRAIMEKLGAKDRTEAVMKALQRGTIRLQ